MAKARNWNSLTPAYKKRLERSGLNKSKYESGADLRAARGHAPRGSQILDKEQKALLDRAIRAEATPQEINRLEKILLRPSWLPNSVKVRPEVLGALSKLPNPKNWKHVYIVPAESGPWTMTVYTKRGLYPNTIEIPGGGGAQGEAPREVIDAIKAISKKLEIDYTDQVNPSSKDEFWSVMDTDAKTPKK